MSNIFKMLLLACFILILQNQSLTAAKVTEHHKKNVKKNETRLSVDTMFNTLKSKKESDLPPVDKIKTKITQKIAKLGVPFSRLTPSNHFSTPWDNALAARLNYDCGHRELLRVFFVMQTKKTKLQKYDRVAKRVL